VATTPTCGKLGGTFANANAGTLTTAIKTLVAFGVCSALAMSSRRRYYAGGVLTSTSPRAGGRVTDGPVWAEGVANVFGATMTFY
ncbi:hypothetical protein B0H19DRAFT_872628, partial [Mycena capillaripes]